MKHSSKSKKKSAKTSRKERLPRHIYLAELAMQAAARKVREENKRLGEPLIVADENGNVKFIPASEL